MKRIPAEVVERTRQRVGRMQASEADLLIRKLTEQQPFLFAYLMAAEEGRFNHHERNLFIQFGLILWRIMSHGDEPLRPLSEEDLEAAESANIRMLEYLEGEPEADFVQTVRTMTAGYNQLEILRFLLESLMTRPVNGEGFRPENAGLAMIHLKTVLDCLDR